MIKQDFKKIETWLGENAQKILSFSLQEPASMDQIDELEKTIDKSLPEDFKALYLWHNGLNDEENFGSIFYGMDFFPISRVIEEYQDARENQNLEDEPLKKADAEIDPGTIYNRNWIKFAFDGSHTGLFIDLAPTEEGRYGQIIFVDDEYSTAILVANSTADLITNFRRDLERNLYRLDEDALTDENHYLIANPTIDIINWESSEVWKR